MSRTKNQIIIICVLLAILIAGIIAFVISSNSTNSVTQQKSTFTGDSNEIKVEVTNTEVSYDTSDTNTSWDESTGTKIALSDNGSVVNGNGATISGNTITITKSGDYYVSGTLSSGSIVVDADKNAIIHIILGGVSITSNENSAIYVKTADKIIITLQDGTTNTLTDISNYTNTGDEDINAVIYSKSDLVINGNGTLNIKANYKDGIASNDGLKIISGTINITANDDGIRGKDYVIIKNGKMTINANGDGVKSTNDTDTSLGYIVIDGGTINVTTGNDGIQAETVLTINDGVINIVSGSGSSNASTTKSQDYFGFSKNTNSSSSDEESTKGLKAGSEINIKSGTITIDTADDAIHSNGNITITGGNITITAGDDGIHADSSIKITEGTINITKSYEGIEASYIQIDGGTISLVASDDGINISGGNESSSFGQFTSSTKTNQKLIVNGGNITVNANGDGLDANGSIYINGGYVVVDGPTSSGNAALDYDGECVVTGGTLISSGSTGMMQTPSTNSTQYSVAIVANGSANQTVTLKDSSGNTIVSFTPTKSYQSVVVSSANLKQGETYTLYSGSTTLGSITVNSIVTSNGSTGMQGGSFGGFGGGMKGGMQNK